MFGSTLLAACTASGGPRACEPKFAAAATLEERFEAQSELRGTDLVTRHVDRMGRSLARRVEPHAFTFQFDVVRDPQANAFSTGSGQIYLTDGMIASCENEAQLAAVLAHEIAHHAAGHLCRPERSLWKKLLGGREEGADAETRAVGVGIRQTVDPRREREADRMAVWILRQAGYDPRESLVLARFMERVGRTATGEEDESERIQALERVLAGVAPGGVRHTASFRVVKQRIERERRARFEPL